MYLKTLTLRNFRKYGEGANAQPLTLGFRPGLNIIVGENDSGKSCIVDAVHLVLFDESNGWMRVDEDDFHGNTTSLNISCTFRGLSDEEAKNFLEWLSFDETGDYYLRLTLRADRRSSGTFSDTRAGSDGEGAPLTKEARQYLCATYLKPLRDAGREMSPGKRSRLAQILHSHPDLAREADGSHPLVDAVGTANQFIREYFGTEGGGGNSVYQRLTSNLEQLRRDQADLSARIDLDTPTLKHILEKLALRFGEDQFSPGLGSHNLLFIAAELLMLKEEHEGLKLALIEELEAHLDPQAQLRVMQFFEREAADGIQMIVSTHSPNLASVADLEGLIICRNGKVFPMAREHTMLNSDDYAFLRRFLDATKSNLFFASGVLIVEGPAENILLPTLARIATGQSLAKFGVSVVNVGSTALLRYAKIFHRRSGDAMGIPISCITDRDIPPIEALTRQLITTKRKTESDYSAEQIESKNKDRMTALNSMDVQTFCSPCWTLEYDIALSCFAPYMHQAIALARKTTGMPAELSEADRTEILETASGEVATWKAAMTPHEVACTIYEPLALKQVSKAASAEFLAQLLDEQFSADPLSIQAEMLNDTHLAYLREAILHASGGTHA